MDYFKILVENRIPEIDHSSLKVKEHMERISDFEKRCVFLETSLKFHNIQKPMMNYDWNDLKTREMMEDIFSPTQRRMLEIQDKFGTLCEMQTD